MFVRFLIFSILLILGFGTLSAKAGNVLYNPKIKLKVGQSIVMKGVRNRKCEKTTAPSMAALPKLPKLKTGTIRAAGVGKAESRHCKGVVPVRIIKFHAMRPGRENVKVYGDKFSIIVTK